MRVNSSLEGNHRFLGLYGLSYLLRNLDERVPLTNVTMSETLTLKYYISSHTRDPRLIS